MNNLLRKSKLFLTRNAPTILTCIGGVGVVATSVMAVKATPKALRALEAAKEEKGEELTKFEVVKVAGPAYIPSVLMGTATITCIFGANMLNKRQQAALMSAYALLDNSYKDYRHKMQELYGEEADTKVKEEIAKDKYEEAHVVVDDENKRLYFDSFSGHYFESTPEDVQYAEYLLNRDIALMGSACVNDFYNLLNIPCVPGGDELGWSECGLMEMAWSPWLDFFHHDVTMDDGRDCTIITMSTDPMIDYEYY